MNEPGSSPRPPGLGQVIGSVIAAAMGVQSERNRERDFTQGGHSMHRYVVIGIIGTVTFVVTMILVVRLVLHLAA